MTYMTHQQTAEAIAISIWAITTGNGHKLDADLHDEHMQNCHAAVANSWVEDISDDEWQDRAIAQLTDTLEIWYVDADPANGEWVGEPTTDGERVSRQEWAAKRDDEFEHYDTYVYNADTQSQRAIVVRWINE